MAFSTTHRTILERNIRHVYSDYKPPLHVQNKTCIQYLDHQDPAKRFHEERLKPSDKFRARSMVYIPEYDTLLPKAPAFRELSATDVRRLVGRLGRPIQCQVTDFVCHKEATRQMKDMCGYCELNAGPYTVSKRHLDGINERLQRPTTSCSNRSRMRCLKKFDVYEINDSCPKAGTRPNSLLPKRNKSAKSRPQTAA